MQVWNTNGVTLHYLYAMRLRLQQGLKMNKGVLSDKTKSTAIVHVFFNVAQASKIIIWDHPVFFPHQLSLNPLEMFNKNASNKLIIPAQELTVCLWCGI